MKELDFTGEWLTKDGSKAIVNPSTFISKPRAKFLGIVVTEGRGFSSGIEWDADGRCPGFSGWDLQKRLDGYTNE